MHPVQSMGLDGMLERFGMPAEVFIIRLSDSFNGRIRSYRFFSASAICCILDITASFGHHDASVQHAADDGDHSINTHQSPLTNHHSIISHHCHHSTVPAQAVTRRCPVPL